MSKGVLYPSIPTSRGSELRSETWCLLVILSHLVTGRTQKLLLLQKENFPVLATDITFRTFTS